MPSPIRFNCGEFYPGQEPLHIPGLRPPVPPVYIPADPVRPDIPLASHPIRIPPFIPDIPGGIINVRYDPFGPLNPYVSSTGGPGTIGTSDPFIPNIPGSAGTVGTILPGNTNSSRFRCNEVVFYCPEDIGIEPPSNRRIRETRRFCVTCTQQLIPETGNLVWPADCIHETREACVSVCRNSEISECISSPNQTNTAGLQVVQVINPNGLLETNLNTNVVGSSRPVQIVNIQEVGGNNTNVVGSFRPEGVFLYHPALNIIQATNTTQVLWTNNERYLNILSSRVVVEIPYILGISNTNSHWSELPMQTLTLEKVRDSLNLELRSAFQNIHYPGGIPVNPNIFYETVRRHILTGRLDEFDPNYYLELSRRQYHDARIQYNTNTAREYIDRAALGLISVNGISSDPSNFESIQRSQLSRQRRLNEDIKARINVCTLGNGSLLEMKLTDGGICNPNGGPIPIGPGHGYYIQIDSLNNGCIGLETTNDLSSSYYVPGEVRFNALTLLGINPAVTLNSESISLQGEFDSTFSVSDISLSPKYFALVLSSIDEDLTINPLVVRTSARYELLDSQELIDEHTNSNGFAVSRVSLDHTDFLFKYMVDSSSISLSQYDITFRGFESNNGIIQNTIISRNIPFGLIITTSKGSKFNPFGVRSKITDFSSSITRSINVVPSINVNDFAPPESPLEERVMYYETSGYRIGVVEPNATQNIVHRFSASSENLTNTFYENGSYVSANAMVSSYGISYMVRNVLDNLIDTYDPSSLTWWDIYSRIPASKFGELMYDNSIPLQLALAQGFRNEVKIYPILDRYEEESLSILDEDSMTVLKKDQRYARSNS
jgi:hypothetical protein